MNTVLVANCVSFMGSLTMVATGLCKTKKGILIMQSVMSLLMACANLMLGGMAGVVINCVTIVRNLVTFFVPFTLPLKIVFIVVSTAISLLTNTNGLIGLLPILSCVVFTWYLDTENEIKLKIVCIVTCLMWVAYDLTMLNYSGSLFDVITAVSNVVGILAIRRDRKKKA